MIVIQLKQVLAVQGIISISEMSRGAAGMVGSCNLVRNLSLFVSRLCFLLCGVDSQPVWATSPGLHPTSLGPPAEKERFFFDGSTKVLTITHIDHTWTLCPPSSWGWSQPQPYLMDKSGKKSGSLRKNEGGGLVLSNCFLLWFPRAAAGVPIKPCLKFSSGFINFY